MLENLSRDVSVWILTLDYRVILLHPLLFGHNSIVVNKCLSNIALALGIVPPSTHLLEVPVVAIVLPLVDGAVVVKVTESVLVADVGLKAHMIIDDVVKIVEKWQDKLQVFARVPKLIALETICIIASTASKVVKDFTVE